VLHVLLLVASAAAIYFSCELFVNAVEHLGKLLRLGTLAIGTVLAAIGTALPESVVTGVAVTGGTTKDVGVGAALGGPLALATLAYGVVGVVLLTRRSAMPDFETRRLARDQTAFLGIFAAIIVLGLVSFTGKRWVGLVFFALYAAYVVVELRSDDEVHGDDLEPLRLGGSDIPGPLPVIVQTLATLAVVFVASQVFVAHHPTHPPQLGISGAVTALLLAPVATELPEVLNAVIWVRQGKVQLAMSNVSGSMMVQATVPSGLGLLFTPWRLDSALRVSVLVTFAAITYLLLLMRAGRLTPRALAGAGAFYLAFAVLLVLV